jgi:transaldolase
MIFLILVVKYDTNQIKILTEAAELMELGTDPGASIKLAVGSRGISLNDSR